jgi:hypothetical protein
MPIPRRTSVSALEAPIQESGVYHAVNGKRIDELDDAFDDEFPDLPSLMPGPRDIAMTKAALPKEMEVPDLVFDGPTRKAPMFRTSSAANIAAVRAPDLELPIRTSSSANIAAVRPPPAPSAPSLDFASEPPPREIALDFPMRTSSNANMAAVRSPVPSFESFDDESVVDIPLDIKTAPKNQTAMLSMSGAEMSPAPASGPTPISSTQKAHDPRPGIVAFAGYGLPPESLGAAPAYAVRVIMRKFALRDDLRIARLRRIQDVSLYEAALEAADEGAVTKGLALIAATVIGGVGAVVAAAAFLL